MNTINYRVSLDMLDVLSQKSIKAKKGDSACKILVTLTENGKLYKIGEGCSASFTAKKPDSTFIYESCSIDGDTIVYDFKSSIDENGVCQISVCEGAVDCEVTLYNANGEQLTSPRFTLLIDGTVYNGEEIVSSTQSDILDDLAEALIESNVNALIKEVDTAVETAEDAATRAEESARSLENTLGDINDALDAIISKQENLIDEGLEV